jgi:uncharacterized protein YndB with AHSA1/START domain
MSVASARVRHEGMAIHFHSHIDAKPAALYAYLTDGDTFAAATGMAARIEAREGSAFSLFDGRIEGRQIELVPDERVVQAWRFGDAHPDPWAPGVFSVVRFTLSAQSGGTRLTIDHDAVPPEWVEHLERGYPLFYSEPMARHFSGSGAGTA